MYEIGDELMGEELMGDEIDRMLTVGAVPSSYHPLKMRSVAPTRSREFVLGLDSGAGTVAVGAVANVRVQPQVPFRPERLVIPSDIADAFTIDDIIAGKDSQVASRAFGIPARAFDESGVGVRLGMKTVQIAQDFQVNVTNISGAIVRFRAAVIGAAVE